MATLRDVWISRGMTSTQVAGAAGITVSTLYRCNRMEENVTFHTVLSVCRVLGLTLDQYAALDACPHADRYRKDTAND